MPRSYHWPARDDLHYDVPFVWRSPDKIIPSFLLSPKYQIASSIQRVRKEEMGYVEVYCQLCTVSFNIARVRTPHEPPSSAWGSSSPRPSYTRDEQESRCIVFGEAMKSGCKNLGPDSVHCAGQGCSFSGGYSGWRIGVEEMKVCYCIIYSRKLRKRLVGWYN